jgi:GLPGLI family protein
MLYFYEDQLLEFYVEEPLTQFNWEVGKKTMHILGYKCTEAKTHYRGRDYIAWFTTDLPYKAAPWKFHGLPGVILKVKSKDDFVDMEAIELKLKEGDEPKNPFKGKTFITNKEFEKKYRSKIVKDRGSMKAMDVRNGGNYIPTIRPRAEIIVEENGMTVEDLQKLMQ